MNRDKHQAALDGIRGFAALSVVLFHVGHWLHAPLASNSGLAVDLFFLLSGYVLTLAYARRFDNDMTLKRFLLIRLMRLMPLVVLSTLISAAYVIMRIQVKHEYIAISSFIIAIFLGLINLPYLTSPLSIGGDQVFPLNGPQYSLFLEIVANMLWAAAPFLRKGWVAGSLAVGCFILVTVTGVLGGDTPNTFIAGFPRVGASFLAGVAVFHIEAILPPWRGWPTVFWFCCAVMLAAFYAPPLPFEANLVWAITVSPLLVLSGTRTILHGRLHNLALLGGRLSYPIYVLHYPLFTWINGIFQTFTHQQDIIIEGFILVITVIVVSLIALRVYDEPLRERLNIIVRRRERRATLRSV